MGRKYTNILLFLLMLTVGTSAQTEDTPTDDYVLESDDYVLSFDSLKVKDKLHYSFVIGAGFSTSSYGNYFNTFYKPTISYDVSSKFTLNTGITYVNSSVNNFPVMSDYSYQLFSGNISQYYAFVGGQYKVTDKLSVGGSVFYDFTSFNTFDGTQLNTSSGLDNLGYSANFKYQVSKSFSIEGEIRLNDKNPYHHNSGFFSHGIMGGGFGNSFFER